MGYNGLNIESQYFRLGLGVFNVKGLKAIISQLKRDGVYLGALRYLLEINQWTPSVHYLSFLSCNKIYQSISLSKVCDCTPTKYGWGVIKTLW